METEQQLHLLTHRLNVLMDLCGDLRGSAKSVSRYACDDSVRLSHLCNFGPPEYNAPPEGLRVKDRPHYNGKYVAMLSKRR